MCMRLQLTSSRASGHTLSSGSVDSASILLQGLVGDTANAVSRLARFDLEGGGRGDGEKAKENGGDGELHFG
jgi:hypothetical protein